MAAQPPADLLDLQRAYHVADERVQELSAALPSGVDVFALQAERDVEGEQRLHEARAERLRIVGALYGHPWFTEVDDRHAVRMVLQAAALA